MRLAITHYAAGDKQIGYREVDSVLEREPKNVSALLIKGRFLSSERRPKDALATAQKALEIDPKSEYGQYLKGSALEATGEKNEAIKVFQALLVQSPGL